MTSCLAGESVRVDQVLCGTVLLSRRDAVRQTYDIFVTVFPKKKNTILCSYRIIVKTSAETKNINHKAFTFWIIHSRCALRFKVLNDMLAKFKLLLQSVLAPQSVVAAVLTNYPLCPLRQDTSIDNSLRIIHYLFNKLRVKMYFFLQTHDIVL